MRDAFAVLFFVSVGMLLDPRALLDFARSGGGRARSRSHRQAGRGAAPGLGAEVSVQSGADGRHRARADRRVLVHPRDPRPRLGILTTSATNVLVATSIASIVLNPIAYRTIRPLERWVGERPRLRALLNRTAATPSDLTAPHVEHTDDPDHRAVVIGFGPTGRTVVRLLRDNGIAPTVIELNMDAVRALRDDGIDAVYGDATRPETLEAAGVARAGSLILGSAGMANSADVIRAGRALNPHIRVLARAPYLRDVAALKKAGATSVYSGEGEVAVAFIADILDSLGATPEQMDRERARAHFELSADG